MDTPTPSPHAFSQLHRPPAAAMDTQTEDRADGTGLGAAAKFVGRVAQLAMPEVRAAVAAWHQIMRTGPDAWVAAEASLAHAIAASGRRVEQKPMLTAMAHCFARSVWYGAGLGQTDGGVPETYVGATEASGQYIGTVAMLALLVRDHLDSPTFELLYRPFVTAIPTTELGRE